MILALALGVAMSNGITARVVVSHAGPPFPVEIVALDQDHHEIPVVALPQRLRVGHNRQRTVRVPDPTHRHSVMRRLLLTLCSSAVLLSTAGPAQAQIYPQRFEGGRVSSRHFDGRSMLFVRA